MFRSAQQHFPNTVDATGWVILRKIVKDRSALLLAIAALGLGFIGLAWALAKLFATGGYGVVFSFIGDAGKQVGIPGLAGAAGAAAAGASAKGAGTGSDGGNFPPGVRASPGTQVTPDGRGGYQFTFPSGVVTNVPPDQPPMFPPGDSEVVTKGGRHGVHEGISSAEAAWDPDCPGCHPDTHGA